MLEREGWHSALAPIFGSYTLWRPNCLGSYTGAPDCLGSSLGWLCHSAASASSPRVGISSGISESAGEYCGESSEYCGDSGA